MKILAQIDTSRDGNDCYIYEVWSLVDVCGATVVLRIHKVSGWSEKEITSEVYHISDMETDHPEILQRLLDLL